MYILKVGVFRGTPEQWVKETNETRKAGPKKRASTDTTKGKPILKKNTTEKDAMDIDTAQQQGGSTGRCRGTSSRKQASDFHR